MLVQVSSGISVQLRKYKGNSSFEGARHYPQGSLMVYAMLVVWILVYGYLSSYRYSKRSSTWLKTASVGVRSHNLTNDRIDHNLELLQLRPQTFLVVGAFRAMIPAT